MKPEIRGKSSNKKPLAGKATLSADQPKHMVVSFKYFDDQQGQTPGEWEKDGLLSLFFDKLKALTQWTRVEADKHILTPYPDYSFDLSEVFTQPKHIPPDVEWASFRLQGKERVIGHVIQNHFFVVFLDRHHKFYPSKKKYT